MGAAEIPTQDVCEAIEDVCGTEKCGVSVAQLSSPCMNLAGETRCPNVVMRLREEGNSVGGVAAEECGIRVNQISKKIIGDLQQQCYPILLY